MQHIQNLKNLEERRDQVLSLFVETQAKLEKLNQDLDEEITSTKNDINELSNLLVSLESLKSKNKGSMNLLKKFF